ncbi:MAG: hypothetical protein CVT84_18065 [Alphaproteobacteria bacterium HGW-Alphaproteobacteria-6]|nr:MAG: hypothetical protein CVT84_18065 [Alphaproteobacteria bacterium HGW-Alphaproteobacteria-6]
MTGAETLARLGALIEADQAPLPAPARAMAEAIRARHGAAVQALLFYGSALREGEGAGRMLDFYVIVDRYRSLHGAGLAALAAWALPPSVHFLQITDAGGQRLSSKYAVISEPAFHRRAGGGSLEPMLWARFAQPATILADDPAIRARLVRTLARACRHFAAEVAPLLRGPVGPDELWRRGLMESYRTELRPERPGPRAAEIVARFPERYAALSAILLPGDGAGGFIAADAGRLARLACAGRWALRRLIGKPLGAARVLKAATTFDGGLDYVLDKVARHSGVTIAVGARARRHPVLAAPWIAWRLYRAGAFR